MSTTRDIATGKKSDVFFVRHISTINPLAKIPLQGEEWTETVNAQGSRVVTDPKPFEQGWFPETLQGIRFPYSVSNGYRFDSTLFGDTKEARNALVEACGFVYTKGKDAGKVINETNPMNPDDPFFAHTNFVLKLEEFGGGYDLSAALNKALYACLKTDDRFLVIENNDEIPDVSLISPKVEYLVTRSSIKDAMEQQKGATIMEMYAKLEKASLSELKVIASIWGDINTNEDTSERMLKEQFAFRFESKKKIPGSNKTYADSFFELIAIKGDRLNTKYLMKVAKQMGVIRMTNIGFTFNNNPLGSNEEAVEAFLLNPNNGSLRQAIQLEINGNKPEAASSPEVPVSDL